MGFRAADASSMRMLSTAFPARSFQEIILVEDIASRHPAITNALAAIAVQIKGNVSVPQRRLLGQSKIVSNENVEGKIFVEETAELAWLANRLRVLHVDKKIPWSQMAVVARSRSVLERWASALASESVPTLIHGSQTSFKDEYATGNLLRLAKFCIERPELNREVILEILRNPYSGLDSLAIRRIRRRLRQLELDNGGQRTSDLLLLELFEKPEVAGELYGEEGKRVRRFLKVLERATEQSQTEGTTAEEVLWTIWDNSPANENWLELSRGISEVALQASRNLDSVVALFAAANRFAERHPGVPASEFIEEQLERDIPQDTLALVSRDDEKVMLSVSPAMIGRRFRVVAIPGLTEGVWPNLKPRSSLLGANILDSVFSKKDASQTRSELEDEYRLFYKAVGAASERLIITAVNSEEQQVSQFIRTVLGTVPEARPYAATRYTLRGMVGNLRRTLVTTQDEAVRLESAYGLARLALENQPGANPKQWAGILKFDTPEALVPLEEGEGGKVWIYPSQLDAFIKCPLHWFMQAHGGTDKSFEANFGTLLHKVLEETESITYVDLWKGVQSKWHTLDFEATWVEKREERKAKKMVEHLCNYLAKRKEANYELVGTEVELDFEYGRARIKGRVDRVEQGPDGKIVIVDLKTGTSAPKAEENSQLGLYQIAFLEGGFKGAVDSSAQLEGAALLLVGGKKDDLRPQASLAEDEELQKFFRNQLDSAIEGMSAADATFVANVGSHCSDSRGYGNCNLLLTKAVSYVD
jgi:RecB family exonuclease